MESEATVAGFGIVAAMISRMGADWIAVTVVLIGDDGRSEIS